MFKKLLAMMLAVMTVFSLSSVAFAHENVDNTFDHFTPEPGVEAPDDWYDPYCYESDGRINKYCLNQGGGLISSDQVAIYCPEHKKIFTISKMGRKEFVNKPFIGEDGETYIRVNPPKTETFRPYEVDWVIPSTGEIQHQWFCPYCGQYRTAYNLDNTQDSAKSAIYTHQGISSVVYGFYCDKCNAFAADTCWAQGVDEPTPYQFTTKGQHWTPNLDIDSIDVNTVKLYRFLTERQRNAEYSFIFKETEKDFGDGKDGRVEDLTTDRTGDFNGWDSPDNPYAVAKEKTFFEKVVDFFASIADFFKRIFTGIFNF